MPLSRGLAELICCHEKASRELTFPKDEFLALPGIVRYVSQVRPGDTYLVSLWKMELPANLSCGVTGQTTNPPAYRAP